jgi:hypothetical protein
MEYPSALRVKRVSTVHRATIVPEDEISNLPDVLPNELFFVDITPKLFE